MITKSAQSIREAAAYRNNPVCFLQITSSKFMDAFADISQTETKDGFNPLLEDYSNTCFYLSASQI